MDQVDQSFYSAAISQEIVDNQHVISGIEIFFRNNHMIHFIMGKGSDFCSIHLCIHIAAGGLFGKYHRDPEMDGRQAGNPDTGSFYGQNLIDGPVFEQLIEFSSQLADKGHIDLVIQEAVHLQYISAFNDAVCQNLLLQNVVPCHKQILPGPSDK